MSPVSLAMKRGDNKNQYKRTHETYRCCGCLLTVLAIAAICVVAVMLFTAFYIANDARRRGQNVFLVVLLCVVFFPVAPLLWLIFRPALVRPVRRVIVPEE